MAEDPESYWSDIMIFFSILSTFLLPLSMNACKCVPTVEQLVAANLTQKHLQYVCSILRYIDLGTDRDGYT